MATPKHPGVYAQVANNTGSLTIKAQNGTGPGMGGDLILQGGSGSGHIKIGSGTTWQKAHDDFVEYVGIVMGNEPFDVVRVSKGGPELVLVPIDIAPRKLKRLYTGSRKTFGAVGGVVIEPVPVHLFPIIASAARLGGCDAVDNVIRSELGDDA